MSETFKIEIEIKKCSECPNSKEVYEQGFCGIVCKALGSYTLIANEGIRKNCPLLRSDKK